MLSEEVDILTGAEPDSSPEGDGKDAVEAEESTERRQGVDGMTAKTAPGATRGEGKTGPGTAEMGTRENIQPPGGASGGSLATFFPFSRQIAGISNKKEEAESKCVFPRLGASI